MRSDRKGQHSTLINDHYRIGLVWLETSTATVKRDWAYARAWLLERMGGEDARE